MPDQRNDLIAQFIDYAQRAGCDIEQIRLGRWLIERWLFGNEYEHESIDPADPRLELICKIADEFAKTRPRKRYRQALIWYYRDGEGRIHAAVMWDPSDRTEQMRLQRARKLLFDTIVRDCL